MTGFDLRRLAGGFSFLETPRWRDERLWAIDLYTERVLGIAPDGGVVDELRVGEVPAGIAWDASGELLVLTRSGRLLHRTTAGSLSERARLQAGPAPCNEITVDPYGNILVGVFGLASGALLTVDATGRSRRVAEDLLLPNGQALADDGRTLLVAESAGQRITAFTIDPDGSLTDRRPWAVLGAPASSRSLPEVFQQVDTWLDGIAVDSDGACWVADAFGRRALRLDQTGRITDIIDTGDQGCYACAVGGDDRNTLYLCAAPPNQDEDTRRRTMAAQLLAVPLSAVTTDWEPPGGAATR